MGGTSTRLVLGLFVVCSCVNRGDQAGQVVGLIADSAGTPIPGSHATAGEADATAGDGGMFELPADAGIAVVRFDAPGYGEAVRRVTVEPGVSSYVEIRLRDLAAVHTVELPAAGSSVTVTDGMASLALAGGSLCRADGSAIDGAIDVRITGYPASDGQVSPADLQTTDDLELVTAGMVDVQIAKDGEALAICGSGSQLTVPAPGFGDLDPTTFRHYELDDQGLWLDVGSGSYDAASGAWSDGLGRLGPHNIDVPQVSGTINGSIRNAFGGPVKGARINAKVLLSQPAFRDANTGDDGKYSFRATTPHGRDTVNVNLDPNSCVIQDQVPVTSAASVVLSTNGVQTVDFQLCLVPNAACGTSGLCCSGSCQDHVCM